MHKNVTKRLTKKEQLQQQQHKTKKNSIEEVDILDKKRRLETMKCLFSQHPDMDEKLGDEVRDFFLSRKPKMDDELMNKLAKLEFERCSNALLKSKNLLRLTKARKYKLLTKETNVSFEKTIDYLFPKFFLIDDKVRIELPELFLPENFNGNKMNLKNGKLWRKIVKFEFERRSNILLKSKNLLIHLKSKNLVKFEFERRSNILLKSKNLLIHLKSKNLLKPKIMIACPVIGCRKRKENIRLKYTAIL